MIDKVANMGVGKGARGSWVGGLGTGVSGPGSGGLGGRPRSWGPTGPSTSSILYFLHLLMEKWRPWDDVLLRQIGLVESSNCVHLV